MEANLLNERISCGTNGISLRLGGNRGERARVRTRERACLCGPPPPQAPPLFMSCVCGGNVVERCVKGTVALRAPHGVCDPMI